MLINIIKNQEVGFMNTYERFKEIVDDYDSKLFEMFREIIDTAISNSMEMNALDRYVYVNNAIEDAYKRLACAQGIISSFNLPYKVDPPISESLMEKIYSYVEPITEEARVYLQGEVDKILDSSTISELMEKLESFKAMLEEKEVDSFMYEDLEIKKEFK